MNIPAFQRFGALSLLGSLVLLTSCSLTGPSSDVIAPGDLTPVNGTSMELRPLSDEENSGDISAKDKFPDYKREAVSPEAKIFLIAGASTNPNFLQEIVDQRKLWLDLGYQPHEIAAYYVQPTRAEYLLNPARFDKLAAQTEGFYLAAPHLIYRHLKAVAQNSPKFVYIYATSRGNGPVTVETAASEQEKMMAKVFPDYIGQYRLNLAGGPSGHMNGRMRLEALRDGIDIKHLLFAPRYLRACLSEFPESTRKMLVLQGCHTGGFVDGASEADSLKGVPNVTVLASSRQDRESFGCGEGTFYTTYGDFFLSTLMGQDDRVENLPWARIADSMAAQINQEEKRKGVVESEQAHPLYFTNVGGTEILKVEAMPEPAPPTEVIAADAVSEGFEVEGMPELRAEPIETGAGALEPPTVPEDLQPVNGLNQGANEAPAEP